MERILYFDCFFGISGDMTIAALMDLGLDEKAVLAELEKLGLSGYEIEINKVNRFSISGTDVNVKLKADFEVHHSHKGEEHKDTAHTHENPHFNQTAHTHENPKDYSDTHTHENGERSLSHISHIISNSQITERAKSLALSIFLEIAKAEAVVHGKSVEDVHFHEVGAVDSIVDIVGTAICLDMLKIDKVVCSPVHDGQGFVNCQHGLLPIPVPAVAQMLKNSGIPLIVEDVQAELVTPTGFGILKTIKKECGKMPEMEVLAIGYGFGKTDTGRLNALRVFLGSNNMEKADKQNEFQQDSVILMESNIDDCTGEILGYTLDRLMEAGALDAYFTPIQMKKNRPGVIMAVICKSEDQNTLAKIIFRETGTLGIRIGDSRRITLERDVRTIQTDFGPINAKFTNLEGNISFKPEYEDCVKIAKKHNLSLKFVREKVK